LDQAIEVCRKECSQNPSKLHSHKLLTHLLSKRAEAEEARNYKASDGTTFAELIAIANQALELQRSDIESHHNLGVACGKSASYIENALVPNLAAFTELRDRANGGLPGPERKALATALLLLAQHHLSIAAGLREDNSAHANRADMFASRRRHPEVRQQALSFLTLLQKLREQQKVQPVTLLDRVLQGTFVHVSAFDALPAAKGEAERWRLGCKLMDVVCSQHIVRNTVKKLSNVDKAFALGPKQLTLIDPKSLTFETSDIGVAPDEETPITLTWLFVFRSGKEVLGVYCSARGIKTEPDLVLSGVGEIPITNWKIDSDQAIKFAAASGAVECAGQYRLSIETLNGEQVPLWRIPFAVNDTNEFNPWVAVRADTGKLLTLLKDGANKWEWKPYERTTTPKSLMQDRGEKASHAKIYIDSVPPGANVYVLIDTPGDKDEKERLLGTTPLTVEPSECPSMRFYVIMEMAQYLKSVDVIPEMKKWVAQFRSDQFFNENGAYTQHYFEFAEGGLERILVKPGAGVDALGPHCKLDWPMQNRLCVLFIPMEIPPSAFYGLMPKPGTFHIEAHWSDTMQTRYKLTKQQTDEAIQCLSRCGKCMVKVKDPFKENTSRRYTFTVQGPEFGGAMVVGSAETTP
jgi:hypothetical protein